jgi:hypothetical protein
MEHAVLHGEDAVGRHRFIAQEHVPAVKAFAIKQGGKLLGAERSGAQAGKKTEQKSNFFHMLRWNEQ